MIVVTGASGFLGQYVLERLRVQHSSVLVLGGPRGTGRIDICDRLQVDAAFGRLAEAPRVVVHLAAIAHDRASAAEVQRVNVVGTRNVLAAALDHGAARFVLASSATVYGPLRHGRAARETDLCQPIVDYGASKLQAERLVLQASAIQSVVLRFAAIYCARRLDAVRKRAYVPFTHNQLRILLEPGSPKYSLCAAGNAASTVAAAVRFALAPGVYNVADPRPYFQSEVSHHIVTADGWRPLLQVRPGLLRWLMTAVRGVVPPARRNVFEANVSKLLDGVVLDTAKLEAALPEIRTDLVAVLQASGRQVSRPWA
jgi:2-alkyl-3-oxoalkanoate reductase